jgi:hypothetical protein
MKRGTRTKRTILDGVGVVLTGCLLAFGWLGVRLSQIARKPDTKISLLPLDRWFSKGSVTTGPFEGLDLGRQVTNIHVWGCFAVYRTYRCGGNNMTDPPCQ